VQNSHGAFLLHSPLCRDFSLVTADGKVLYKVHLSVLLSGSTVLRETVFPGGVSLTRYRSL
jgi:hypothetical protein